MGDRITLTTVKGMGFTDKLIRDLLPEPELKQNPHYKCASPMKLWEKSVVEKAMQTEIFINAQAQRQKRKESAQKAVKTKTDNLIAQILKDIENISVKRLNMGDLHKRTLEAKQDYYDWRYYDTYYHDAYEADEETQDRWMVNYIRHNLTSYDEELWNMSGKTGKGKAYLIYFEAVLHKIAEIYPELKDECESQIERKVTYSFV